jgi:hypothetical protein
MYCICCKKNNVRPNDLSNNENKSEEEMLWWNEKRNGMNLTISNKEVINGIIQIVNAGYGSKHDGDEFIIAICDDCINENKEDGTLLYYGNYMYPEQIDGEKEKSKKIYRRRKNLDGLV